MKSYDRKIKSIRAKLDKKSSAFALICSFLIPIVGVVAYFAQRDRIENPNSYLTAAFWGFVVNLIICVCTERI